MNEYIGWFAAFFTTSSLLPQVIKVIRTKKVGDLSVFMYFTYIVGIFLWLLYGLFIQDYPVIFASVVSFVLSFIILVFKFRYD